MRKRELLEIRSLYVTDKMREMVENDVGEKKEATWGYYRNQKDVYYIYRWKQYYRAVVVNGILKIAVFTRKLIAAGNTFPQYEIYIDKNRKEWITYNTKEERWHSAKIDMLQYDTDRSYVYGQHDYCEEKDKQIINDYLETGKREPKEAILTYQMEVKKGRLVRKYKSELDQIDAVMNVVPELPKDFDAWVLKYGFYNNHYMLYKTEDKSKAWCSYCNKWVPVKEKISHNQVGKCPSCKLPVIYKAWKKQKYLSDEIYCGIIQRLKDESGYIARKFFCKIKRERNSDYVPIVSGAWEEVRVKLDDNFRQADFFEFGEYKTTGIRRWCHALKNSYYYSNTFGSAMMYSSNMNKLLSNSKLKYMPVKDLLNSSRGKACELLTMLRTLLDNPKYEYLIKAGMKRFVFEITNGHERNFILDNRTKKKPWEYLKIEKDQFKMLCKINAGSTEVRVAQIANESGIRLNQEQIKWLSKYVGRSLLIKEYMQYTTPHKMIRYLRENLKAEQNKNVVGDYYDYLNECEKLSIAMDEQILFPQNFKYAHEMSSKAIQEMKDEKLKKETLLQDIAFKKSQVEKEGLFAFEDDNYIMILPKSKKDFEEEGRNMHNCVGGYFERVSKGTCTVLFLREKKDIQKSYCTVEIKGIELIQCRTAYNKDAPEDVMKFMQKYLKVLEKRLEKDKRNRQIEEKSKDTKRKLLNELGIAM